jgi:membrane glycosyltransferase
VLGLFWRSQPPATPAEGLTVAILLPMYGEPAAETIGNTLRLLADLPAHGRHRFSLHVLSDTRAPVAVALDEAAVVTSCGMHPGLAITWRQRAQTTPYKSGNIRDWVRASGHAHDAMLVLDADSIVGAATVMILADSLAREPGLGLVQTVPRVLPGHTV